MSINTTENTNQQQPITIQPQAHQIQHNYSNKHLNYTTSPYQPSSSTTGQQLTNLNSGLAGQQQLNKKNQQPNQLKLNSQKSALTTTTNNNNQTTSGYRKVFIQRDYSEGTSVKFQNKFPEELEGYIERQHFDYLITTLNCYYDKAEAANLSTFCEGKKK